MQTPPRRRSKRRTHRLAAALVAGVLALAACAEEHGFKLRPATLTAACDAQSSSAPPAIIAICCPRAIVS